MTEPRSYTFQTATLHGKVIGAGVTVLGLSMLLIPDLAVKIKKHLPIVLFGSDYWDKVVDFDALVDFGTIDVADLDLFLRTDSVDEAFDFITVELEEHALASPGATL